MQMEIERRNIHAEYWWRNLSERRHLEYQERDGRITLRWIEIGCEDSR
jgi:hypothetical protein